MEEIDLKKLTKNPWFIVSLVLAITVLLLLYTNSKNIQPSQNLGADDSGSDSDNLGYQQDVGGSDTRDLGTGSYADDDAILGDENAPIEIIEFSDYECPFCTRFYTNTLPQLKTQYIDTGKAKLIYRDFPLDFHANAQKAAEAAECADDQGKYYEMHDKLFEQGVSGGFLHLNNMQKILV